MDDKTVRSVSRRLRDLVEPIAGSIYFVPEAMENYGNLPLDWPEDLSASRGGCMGQVAGEVIASAFGVFYPPMVVGFVNDAWSKTDAPTLLAARQDAAIRSLRRIIGDDPDGRERAT